MTRAESIAEIADVIVFTGALLDAQTLGIVRDQQWGGAAVIGLSDVGDAGLEERLRGIEEYRGTLLP